MCLLICILSLFPGIYSRVSAEQKNKNVIIAADYEEFAYRAQQSGLSREHVINSFRDNGIDSLIVKTSVQSTNKFKELDGKGFKLIPYLNEGKDGVKSDLSLLSSLVNQFNIKYLFLDGSYTKSLSYYEVLSDIINKNNMVAGVFEAAEGPGITGQNNIEGLFEKTDYSISRIYMVPDNDLSVLNTDELYFRYLRAIVDRNIRLIYLRPLKSEGSGINETLNAAERLKEYISLHGYKVGSDINNLDIKTLPLENVTTPVGLMFAVFLLVLYLMEPKAKGLYTAIAIIISLAIGILVYAYQSGTGGITAFLSALVFPSLAITVMIKLLKEYSEKPFLHRLLTSLPAFLLINVAGVCLIIASFSDIRYIMGLSNFPGPGVAMAYSVPLLAAFVAYCKYFKKFKTLLSDIKEFISKHGVAVSSLLFVCVILALYYYLGRSGNGLGTGASKIEIHLREALEQFLTVRPRFKEILVGYPAFVLLVLLIKKYGNKLMILPLVIATVISGVSLTNSFCHSYTPVCISFLRGLYGMLIGLALGFVIYLGLMILEKFKPIRRIKNNNF